jgi:hypothetical protein
MLKIKINDPSSNFRMNLPIPYNFLINIGIRKIWTNIAIKRSSFDDDKTYEMVKNIVDSIDFRILRKSFNELTAYKGLVLIDVKTQDGVIVQIRS